jgi:trehalose 6-phosphate phosphatase
MKRPVVAENVQHLIAPLREIASRAAIALDVDGTIAPIVFRPEDAAVPAETRELLIALQARYALVACVSGRRAEDARRVVGVASLDYIGNHGLERLRAGGARPETHPALDSYRHQVRSFAGDSYGPELRAAGVRLEDKDAIWSFHWREADERSVLAGLEEVAAAASSQGLVPHWGRKVLEIRPPLTFDKGTAIARLLTESDVAGALYAGDDATDLDTFRKLRELHSSGRLSHVVCVGVSSVEGPPAIVNEADVTVDGPVGMRELLAALL